MYIHVLAKAKDLIYGDRKTDFLKACGNFAIFPPYFRKLTGYHTGCYMLYVLYQKINNITNYLIIFCTTGRPFCSYVLCYYGVCRNTNGIAHCICSERCNVKDKNPVCGSDGVTYRNQCSLQKIACRRRKNITVANRDICGKCCYFNKVKFGMF